jgi:hypothetical protein
MGTIHEIGMHGLKFVVNDLQDLWDAQFPTFQYKSPASFTKYIEGSMSLFMKQSNLFLRQLEGVTIVDLLISRILTARNLLRKGYFSGNPLLPYMFMKIECNNYSFFK